MAILEIHVNGVDTLETKGDPPVATHSDSPCATTLTFDLVQVKPRQGHVLR